MAHTAILSPEVVGRFQINVLDGSNERDDPNARGYTVAPQVTKTAREYPLQDFREEVFGEGFSYQRSAELLKKHGFTAVKFDPASLINANEDQVRAQHFDSLSVLEETYYPEVVRSMLNLTGAKEVFITNSIIRRGSGATATEGEGDVTIPRPDSAFKALHDNKPTHMGSSDQAKPSRTPHCDYTPLGARRAIRSWRPDIRAAAERAGVLAAEDRICAGLQLQGSGGTVNAEAPGSSAAIEAEYNAGGERLGPRYAAYSVWRPLRTVTRDPLAMAPRRTFADSPELQFQPYYLKVMAAPSMPGDFLRELEAVGVAGADAQEAVSATPKHAGPQWYYLREQKPDEVIVLKFFDSASLGVEGPDAEAPAVPHASPDLGSAGYGIARESIEVRCIAFW